MASQQPSCTSSRRPSSSYVSRPPNAHLIESGPEWAAYPTCRSHAWTTTVSLHHAFKNFAAVQGSCRSGKRRRTSTEGNLARSPTQRLGRLPGALDTPHLAATMRTLLRGLLITIA